MNTNFPNSITALFEKYGRCKIVNHECPDVGYGVCTVVKTPENEFVLIRNRSNPKVWTLPCGTVKQNESFEEACVREIFEETCLKIQITGLYCIFQFTQKTSVGKNQTESYVVVFLSKVTSGVMSSKSSEILEIKKFDVSKWIEFGYSFTEEYECGMFHLVEKRDYKFTKCLIG